MSTKRRDRINADEEERLRFGYELRTGLRFNEKDGEPDVHTAQVQIAGEDIARPDLCADSHRMEHQSGLAPPREQATVRFHARYRTRILVRQ